MIFRQLPTGPHPAPRLARPDLGRRCHPRNPVRERLDLLEITVKSFGERSKDYYGPWSSPWVMTSLEAGPAERSWPIILGAGAHFS